ncbi:hypothetical protein HYW73_01425 [Candidatus Nomurabacteria bacterium]|nr:hypothetical protein [Candidatus Nomurabacteria bacterium]
MKKIIKRTKKITIDTLAIMMADGFESLETKVGDIIKKEVGGIKEEIKGVKNQLEGTNKRIDDLAMNRVKLEEHNKLKVRVDTLEKHSK